MRLQAKAVYLELERSAMWQSFILKLGVLWFACQLLIYHGSCSHDMKRQVFEEGRNILQISPMQQDQDVFCYRKANLNKCIRSTLRSKDQDFGQLLQEDAHSDLQLSDMPSRSALLSAPARGLLNILDSYLHGSTSSSHRILASQQHPLYDSHLEPSASIDASQFPYTHMHTLVESNPVLPPMQDIQHQNRLYVNMAVTALPPNQPPVEFVSPSFPSSYSQFPHVPSQSLRFSERAYSEKLAPRLAPSPSPVAPFHNIQSPKLSPQSFDVPRKQLPQVLPPLNGQSSVVDKPSLPSNQVPSVTVPTTHSHQHHRHHSELHPALPNPPNAFPKHYPPDQFNGSFPALPPEARPKSFAIPAVSAHSPSSSVPRSARRRRSARHAPIVLPPRNGGRIATSPTSAASEHHRKKPRIPVAASPLIFPSPPPSQDCTTMTCGEPLTYSPPNAPCGCVLPMQIGILLEVAPYAFFPLVSELAAEIAAGTYLKQSQIRIMGATAYSQDQEKTSVSIDLVPLGEKFDNMTAFLTYERFWQKKVIINGTLFGDYQVVSVQYPGLPSLPPSQYSNATVYSGPNGSNSGSNTEQPLGVDVRRKNERMGGGIIAVVALSSAVAVVICLAAVWFMLLKCSHQIKPSPALAPTFVSTATKRSGAGSILSSSMPSSTSFSFVSSMATYTGTARTFTPAELEKATDRFSSRNILGEGGFGRVYGGVLEDGTKLAVKVLTRDDHQGGREFIAEVEMLSRLHHRNLVKLIGICTEEHNRCLVYELIPNGSVESHLHGPDKETAPLDWDTRMKIALGAARGLAYLHEDSNPRVIHRDFKASNILLEDDFTPKVSDFGLAKAATDEGKEYISTRVMGTFGYVAPEYAMTGHLLVKSDVYSYGVVLLELLSGRKPVDMSQPHGQENLVTWARPLLTTKEGLEILVDPSLKGSFSFDNMARVAAIASMCVQIESSHRPFMGEVVQALKLVYNDSDASNKGGSRNSSRGEESLSTENELKQESERTWWPSMHYTPDGTSFVTIDYDSGPLQAQGLDTERPLSASALLSSSGNFISKSSESFRRHSCSGPLRPLRSKPSWYRIRGLTGGSMSEHGLTRHFRTGLDTDDHELWP